MSTQTIAQITPPPAGRQPGPACRSAGGASAASATTGTLAEMLNARLVGPSDLMLNDIAPLDKANPGALTFIRDQRHAAAWPASRASAALVTEGVRLDEPDPAGRALLFVPDADRAMLALLEAFADRSAPEPPEPAVHPTAVVDPTAQVHGAAIGPLCIVGPGARIEAGAVLLARVTIGQGVHVGAHSVLHPGVVVQPGCRIGRHCTLHPGVVVGADGFGYLPGPDGPVKIPHLGAVVVEDHAEIGANTCIDRGKLADTRIGRGTKIDNLCQIGHNGDIGQNVIICGCCAIAGSVTIGDGATIAGGVGIADGVTIGKGATIGARSGVINDVPDGQTWLGIPAVPARQAAANYAQFRTLARDLRALRQRLDHA
ncbi:MAG: UDP-3-O-acylglucosamine N-acyltransferase [Phycisphaerales bacterium]|nr:MAG: UDP-3-O-acylglucosamine N-acyltransferase [Phycisphaerales bacterium]